MSNTTKKTATMEDGKPVSVPKLRFPEFREAEGWDESILGELSEVVRGGSPRPIDGFMTTSADGLNWLKIGDVDKEAKFVTQTAEKVRREALTKTRVVNPGDLILSNSMSFGRPYILQITTCIHDGWIAITKISKKTDRDFLYYLISAPGSQSYFLDNAAGSGVLNLNADIIKALSVCFPSSPEQKKIAACFSSLDELMAAQARKLDALKSHKKGLMQQLFPREGETQPRLRFPEFQNAGEWDAERFDKLLEVIDGDRGANYPKADEYSPSGFCLFLSAANVSKTGFKFEVMQFISKEKDDALRKGKLKRADVVLTTRGTVGQFAFYSDEIPYENIRINSGMVILRTKTKKIAPEYLYSFSGSNVLSSYIKNTAFGNAQQQLTVGEINKFQLRYPSLDEQQRIADCVTNLDDLIAAQTQKLDALKAHKKGLMQQLFPSPGEVEA
uniref:Type I restriction-modification system, specificity subunit S n=1 Tax=Rheinheimera sp. BAL341 TaxID=1708203 RepID=A0A486XKM2_9GAMM